MSDKIKIVLLGDSTVGKTCLTLKYCTNTVTQNHMSTIGVDVHNKEIDTSKGRYRLQIWDTAGQERFRSISASYLRNTDGIFVLFDITSLDTFNSVNEWFQTINENCSKGKGIVIVGNKKDLEADRKVQTDDAKALAERLKAKYIEVSAFTGEGVNDAFLLLTEEILKKGNDFEKSGGVSLDSANKKDKKKCCGGGK